MDTRHTIYTLVSKMLVMLVMSFLFFFPSTFGSLRQNLHTSCKSPDTYFHSVMNLRTDVGVVAM